MSITFKDLKTQLNEAKADIVFSKNMSGVKVEVHKHGNKFIAKIDGDTLDTYNSRQEAEKMAKRFISQYKA